MFEELSHKLQEISNKISNKGFLNEENIVSALQEVKIALLEAENFRVVNSFLKKVKEKAKGTEVLAIFLRKCFKDAGVDFELRKTFRIDNPKFLNHPD